MKTILDIGVLTATILLMFAVGIEMERGSVGGVVRLRTKLPAIWLLQALIPPVIAFGITLLLDLPPHIEAGLLLVAACPVGDIANVYTALARGPVAFSVVVNTTSCAMAAFTMALIFAVYDHLLGKSFAFAIPTFPLLVRILLMAALPIIVGMLLRFYRPAWVDRLRPVMRRLCAASIVLLLIYIVVTQHERIIADWKPTTVAALCFFGMTLPAGWLSARLLGLSPEFRLSTAFLFGVRNLGLMSAVAITLMGHTEYAVFGALYFLVEVPIALALVKYGSPRNI